MLCLAYVVLVLYRVWAIGEEEKTQKAVERIHGQKITLADVMGSNLPPPPNKQENDATVEGVDVNNNGVRDDVELAIFQKYPDSPHVRAAQLQYALTQQMFLTEVFDSETWKAVAEEKSRAFNCISETYPRNDLKKYIEVTDRYTTEVEMLVYNTAVRRETKTKVYELMVSHGDALGETCDINLNMLSN